MMKIPKALALLVFAPLVHAVDCADLACRLEHTPKIRCREMSEGDLCVLPAHVSAAFNYSEEIAVLVPKGVVRPNHIILFMHGNRGLCPTNSAAPETIVQTWHLMQTLGGRKAVVFFPMSVGATVTYDRELAPDFPAFKAWALGLTGAPADTPWVIAGHSGAGRALALILGQRHPEVTQALLLDAAYNVTTAPYSAAWKSAKGGPAQIRHVYTDLSGTASNIAALKQLLGAQFVSRHARTNTHCDVPLTDLGPMLDGL